jgi:hypothetical protein
MSTLTDIVEGRLLFQRMLTLAADKRFDECAAEIFLMKQVGPILAALNIAVNAAAGLLQGMSKGERDGFIQKIMLDFETNPKFQ